MTFGGSLGVMLSAAALAASGAVAAPLVTAFDDDGMVTVNGKRTFIIGSYHPAQGDRPYEELVEAGFNLVQAGPSELDKAAASGLMAWTGAGVIDVANPEESAKAIRERVSAVRDHPALAFLETVDEPAWDWMKATPRWTPEAFAQTYPIIKEVDPNHLLYTNHAPTNLVTTLRKYNAGTDIVACDIYPVNPGGLKHSFALFEDGLQGDLNNVYISQVGEYVDKMRQVTGPSRPLFMVLQGFAWEMLMPENERREEKILFPTYQESRFMAFQSIIKGANGIIYWGHHTTPQPSQAWTDLKRVVREVADLGAPLASRAVPLHIDIEYIEMGRSVDDGIQYLAKEHGGKLYLFTCNADKNLCRATVSGLAGWTTARALYETSEKGDGLRTITLQDGAFTDTWKRFGVHIYELSK